MSSQRDEVRLIMFRLCQRGGDRREARGAFLTLACAIICWR
ncbi:hypothetical protein V6U89_18815 [Micromonospora sp. CPCC 206171]